MVMLAATAMAGCVGAPSAPPPPVPIAVAAPVYRPAGLDRVIGRNANALTSLFGKPDADVREGTARKLQFVGPFCILDAYLYPQGAGTPLVTHIDARQPNGSPIDRASCIAALSRRGGGK